MDPAWIALIGTVFGGIGLKSIEHLFSRSKVKDDTAASLRKELREDLDRYREELRQEAQESDKWQTAYWELKAELMLVNHKTNKAIDSINHRHPEEHLKDDLEGLEHPGR